VEDPAVSMGFRRDLGLVQCGVRMGGVDQEGKWMWVEEKDRNGALAGGIIANAIMTVAQGVTGTGT